VISGGNRSPNDGRTSAAMTPPHSLSAWRPGRAVPTALASAHRGSRRARWAITHCVVRQSTCRPLEEGRWWATRWWARRSGQHSALVSRGQVMAYRWLHGAVTYGTYTCIYVQRLPCRGAAVAERLGGWTGWLEWEWDGVCVWRRISMHFYALLWVCLVLSISGHPDA
jgi:hypothetical protein